MTKKFALALFAANAILGIVFTCIIIDSNNKTTERIAMLTSLESKVIDLEKEVFITPDQLQLSPQRVSRIITDARRLEGTNTVVKIESTTKISRQLFIQGLFYPIFQQFHGADRFSLDNRLPNFREMQWSLKLRTRR